MFDLNPDVEKLLTKLLEVMDNLERAVNAIRMDPDINEAVSEGVRAIHRQLNDLLGIHNLRQFTSVGTKFDPNRHEAMAQMESNTIALNHVGEELRAGYMLGERLFRPAQVTVVTSTVRVEEVVARPVSAPARPSAVKSQERSSLTRPSWLSNPPPSTGATLYLVGLTRGATSSDEGKKRASDEVVPGLFREIANHWSEHELQPVYEELARHIEGRRNQAVWDRLVNSFEPAAEWIDDFFWERLKSEMSGNVYDVAVLAAIRKGEIQAMLEDQAKGQRWSGVVLADLGPLISAVLEESKGALVCDVVAGTIGERAGLLVGDIVTRVDTKPIADAATARRLLTLQSNARRRFKVEFIRGLDMPSSLHIEKRQRTGDRRYR